ncbi:hypothetical protein IAD21_01140 [Abditibacteriota bacterium]|nr:hypothetical protein IAD21_01140 [Abditibacteriota bacterium]
MNTRVLHHYAHTSKIVLGVALVRSGTTVWAAPLVAPRPISSPLPTVPNRNRVVIRDELFPLRDIKLNGGDLGTAQELNRRYLLKLEPDRLLSWFRREAALEPMAPPYRGWESEGRYLPGHILGFYLSGAAMTVQATGDPELHRRLDYIVDQLAQVQAANKSGYMLAVPNGKQIFREIAGGKIEIDGLPWTGYQINDNFEPTYTLNKLMLGLFQVYQATGNPKAKMVLVKLADWFGHDILDKLSLAQIQTLLDCEHGSLNESFTDVYQLTGDAKYLKWGRALCHERMLEPLAKGDGAFLTNYHANTQIPKYTGFENVYWFNGEPKLDTASFNFWNEVVNHRTWVIGGNSANEHFFDPKNVDDALRAQAGPESCNSVNMLRLTEALYRTHPSAHLMDYYERTLWNHILAAHDPERGMCAYYTSMRPGAYRVYSDEFDSMWCCTGTGLEVPGKYGQMIYTHAPDNSSLSVQLFAPSQLTWKAKGVMVSQTTNFPRETVTTLRFTCAKPTSFALKVRHPAWVPDGGLKLTVNGTPVKSDSKRGSYGQLTRAWRTGDVVRIELPMHVYAETPEGDDHYMALLYGPIVLSGALGRSGGVRKSDFWQITSTIGNKTIPEANVPSLIGNSVADIVSRIRPVAGKPLTFRITGADEPGTIDLIPFNDNHFQRYAIYWRRQSPSEAKQERDRLAEAARKRRELDAVSVDSVKIGDDASEKAHNLQSLRSATGNGAYGQLMETHWRDARDGGWFSYDLKVDPTRPQSLRLTYWGKELGARTFDVVVNGQVLTTTSLGDTGKADFYTVDLPLAPQLLAGKTQITVKFQAHTGNSAGGLFDLRVLNIQ